jgi:membrane-associated phospholipid phosphatase
MGHSGGIVWPGQLSIVEAIHRFEQHTAWLHQPMVVFAKYGVVAFAGLLVLSWWQARSRGTATAARALWAPACVLLALGINQFFVHLFAEPRPYDAISGFVPLVARSADYSFPSDHAVMTGATAVGVYVVNRRLGLLTWALAILMAFARVYVGAHFPGDVLAGLLVGAAVAMSSWRIARRPATGLITAVARGPLAFLIDMNSANDPPGMTDQHLVA